MTWSAWVKAAANPADDGQIVAKSNDASGWQFKTSPDTGAHTFAIGVSGGTNAFAQRYSTTVRSLNVWYHVAGVYNAAARTLDIYVNGKHVTVPQAIGFVKDPRTGKFTAITELHTHNGLGIVHVESGQNLTYKLGQLFGEWGVRLTKNCLGEFKGGCNNLQWWVNGKKQSGDPARLHLKNHQEIVIAVGKLPKKLPTSYDFGAHGV